MNWWIHYEIFRSTPILTWGILGYVEILSSPIHQKKCTVYCLITYTPHSTVWSHTLHTPLFGFFLCDLFMVQSKTAVLTLFTGCKTAVLTLFSGCKTAVLTIFRQLSFNSNTVITSLYTHSPQNNSFVTQKHVDEHIQHHYNPPTLTYTT